MKTFVNMILNGEKWRTANHKMTGIDRCFFVQISQIFWVWSVVKRVVFSITSTLLLPFHLYCI